MRFYYQNLHSQEIIKGGIIMEIKCFNCKNKYELAPGQYEDRLSRSLRLDICDDCFSAKIYEDPSAWNRSIPILDMLNEIVDTAEVCEQWPDRNNMLDYGSLFGLGFPMHFIHHLFLGFREMVKTDMFMYSHDIIEDKFGIAHSSFRVEHGKGTLVGTEYYCLIERSERGEPDHYTYRNTLDLHLFYTKPLFLQPNMAEHVLMFYDYHPFGITNRMPDDPVGSNLNIIVSPWEHTPLSYMEIQYLKERDKPLMPEDFQALYQKI